MLCLYIAVHVGLQAILDSAPGHAISRRTRHFTSRERCSELLIVGRVTTTRRTGSECDSPACRHRRPSVARFLSAVSMTNHQPWTWWLTAQTTSSENCNHWCLSAVDCLMQPKHCS